MPREIWVFRYHPTNEIPRHRGAWDDRVSYRAKSDVRFVRGDIHDKTVARADKAEALASDLQAKLTDCCLQALATDGQAIESLERTEKAEAELAKLADPDAVHANMLRGTIAKPSWAQIKHLYAGEADKAEALLAEAQFERDNNRAKLEVKKREYLDASAAKDRAEALLAEAHAAGLREAAEIVRRFISDRPISPGKIYWDVACDAILARAAEGGSHE